MMINADDVTRAKTNYETLMAEKRHILSYLNIDMLTSKSVKDIAGRCNDTNGSKTIKVLRSMESDGLVLNEGPGHEDAVHGNTKYSIRGEGMKYLLSSDSNSTLIFFARQFRNKDRDCESATRYHDNLDKFEEKCNKRLKESGVPMEICNPLKDKPQAGKIPEHMEYHIRQSRFVIADLSHSNNGAYWEAGFASGLGKTVIYLYHDGIDVHFDVRSIQAVIIKNNDIDRAVDDCIAIIKNTMAREEDAR